jgi:putative salt-induced outer membrane protein
MRLRAFAVLLAFVSVPALAQETVPTIPVEPVKQEPPPPPPWNGEVSAGYVQTEGNSDTRTSNARAEVIYQSKDWRNTFNAAAIQSQSSQLNELTGTEETQVSAERYSAGNKTDYNFTDRDYAFLSLEWEKDLIGGVRERTSETVGYGRKVLTGPAHLLDLELGAGVRQTEEQITANKAEDAIGRARLAYKWNFSETSFFGETIKAESGESNTFTESVTELKLSLIGKLFALASYTVRNNTDVAPGTEKTDTITAASLGWTFGK